MGCVIIQGLLYIEAITGGVFCTSRGVLPSAELLRSRRQKGWGGRRPGGPCRLRGDAVGVADSSAVASAWKCKTELVFKKPTLGTYLF